MPVGLITPELTLAIGAVVVLIGAILLPRRRQGWCALPALVTLAVSGALAVRVQLVETQQLAFHGVWALDGITAAARFVILASAAVVTVLSPRWFRGDARHGEWYVILLFSALGAILLAGAADLMEVMVAALLASVTGYIMASFHRASRMSAEAGAKYYFLGALANPILFLGIVLIYGVTGTTGFQGIELAAAQIDGRSVALLAGTALVLVGLMYKLGAFPVHPWVPDVAQGSPVPAAAFITVAPKIGALVAVLRFVSLLPDPTLPWRPMVAGLAVLTMTVGNLAALWQGDVRRLLGWSSVSQSGYGLLAAVAVGVSPRALPAMVMFIAAYAVANLTAFAVVAALRGRTALEDYRGLGRSRPWHAAALTLAFFSLIGIPPLAGFSAKLVLFAAAIDAGYGWLALVAVINTVVSVFYYLRVIAVMVFPDRQWRQASTMERPRFTPALLGREHSVTMLLGALFVIALGLGAHWLLQAGAAAVLLPR